MRHASVVCAAELSEARDKESIAQQVRWRDNTSSMFLVLRRTIIEEIHCFVTSVGLKRARGVRLVL